MPCASRRTRRLRSPHRLALRLVAVLTAATSLASGTQPAPDPLPLTTIEQTAAAFAEASALIDLRLAPEPVAEDFEIAAISLGLASDLDPSSVELARRWAEAAWSAGRRDELIGATRRVVSLDPSDTVAQLRLISASLGRTQTVGGRLEKLDALLGERGDSLHPAVRSRLALDAALLNRELGQTRAFANRLSEAIRLDPSNKEAILLALTYYEEQVGDKEGTLRLLIRLLYADPLDATTALRISTLLASEAAMVEARRYHDLAWDLVIITLQSGEPDAELFQQRYALLWDEQGPGAISSDIALRLEQFRERAQLKYELDIERDVPEDQLLKPEDLHLPAITEITRTIAAIETGNTEEVDAGLDELAAINRLRIQALLRDGTNRAIRTEAIRSTSDLMIMRLLADRQREALDRQIDDLRREGNDELLSPVTLGWISLRRAGAREALRYIDNADQNLPYDRMLEAVAARAVGDDERAVRSCRRLAAQDPLGIFGAWARHTLRDILGSDRVASATGERLAEISRAVPDWIHDLHKDPFSMMSLGIERTAETIAGTESPTVRVTLRNVSPLRLAIGADRPIGSRMLVTSTSNGTRPLVGAGGAFVVELNRRLSLGSGEAIVAELRPDAGPDKLLSLINADQLTRSSWNIVQSFGIGSLQTVIAGAFGLTDRTEIALSLPLAEARRTPAELADLLRTTTGEPARRALMGSASVVLRLASGAEAAGDTRATRADLPVLIDALAERFRSAPSAERIFMLAALPSSKQIDEMTPFDRAALDVQTELIESGSSFSTAEVALTLTTRVDSVNHPFLDTAVSTGDPDITRLADLITFRFERSVPARATVGPGVEAIISTGAFATNSRQPREAPAAPILRNDNGATGNGRR